MIRKKRTPSYVTLVRFCCIYALFVKANRTLWARKASNTEGNFLNTLQVHYKERQSSETIEPPAERFCQRGGGVAPLRLRLAALYLMIAPFLRGVVVGGSRQLCWVMPQRQSTRKWREIAHNYGCFSPSGSASGLIRGTCGWLAYQFGQCFRFSLHLFCLWPPREP